MSVVAVQVTKEYVEIAADTQMSRNNVIQQGSKMFQDDTGTVFAFTGVAEEGTLLRVYAAEMPLVKDTDGDIVEYFHNFSHFLLKFRDEWCAPENSYVVVKNGKAWTVDGFFVDRIVEYASIGSGSEFALSAMSMGASVEKAIEVAAKFDMYCNTPVEVIRIPILNE